MEINKQAKCEHYGNWLHKWQMHPLLEYSSAVLNCFQIILIILKCMLIKAAYKYMYTVKYAMRKN